MSKKVKKKLTAQIKAPSDEKMEQLKANIKILEDKIDNGEELVKIN